MSSCFFQDDLFAADLVTELKVKDCPLQAPPKGLEMNMEPKEEESSLGLNSKYL